MVVGGKKKKKKGPARLRGVTREGAGSGSGDDDDDGTALPGLRAKQQQRRRCTAAWWPSRRSAAVGLLFLVVLGMVASLLVPAAASDANRFLGTDPGSGHAATADVDATSESSAVSSGSPAPTADARSEEEPGAANAAPQGHQDGKGAPPEASDTTLGSQAWHKLAWCLNILDQYNMAFLRPFLETQVLERTNRCLRSNEGLCGISVPLPFVIALFAVAGIIVAVVVASGAASRSKASEGVRWLNLWWTAHPPEYGRERLERVLLRAINDELRPAAGALGASAKPPRVLAVRLETCALPTISNMRCIETTTEEGARQLFLTCSVHLTGNKDAGILMDVAAPPAHRITTTVINLRAKAYFTMTEGADAVASLSLKKVRDVKLSSKAEDAAVSVGLVNSRLQKALSTCLAAPKSLQWHLTDKRTAGTDSSHLLRQMGGLRSPQAPSRVASHTTTASDLISRFRDGEEIRVKVSVIGGRELITAKTDTSVVCVISVDSPKQRFRTRATEAKNSTCHFHDETVLALQIDSNIAFELYEEAQTATCIGNANIAARHFLQEPNKLTPVALRGRMTNMEIPKGMITVRWRGAKSGDPPLAPASPQSVRSQRAWVPAALGEPSPQRPSAGVIPRSSSAQLIAEVGAPSIHGGWDVPVQQQQQQQQQQRRHYNQEQQEEQGSARQSAGPMLHEHSAVVVEESNGYMSPPQQPASPAPYSPGDGRARLSRDALRRLDERAGVDASPGLRPASAMSAASAITDISQGTGWAFPGRKPVILLETTHSYGTHLAVENVADVPPHIARWKGKTRRLYVMNGHAFTASKATTSGERCAVTRRKLARGLTRKCYRCKFCGVAVEKSQIVNVEDACTKSQLPDMTLGSFSHERMQNTVAEGVMELTHNSSQHVSVPPSPR